MISKEVRSEFLRFFESKKHTIVASAPMVIKDDPTLMFTNAGMNQFKAFFLGVAVPKNNRIADTQKCLRVSGKHNDLEEVGKDTYHHTMFEMLGNWSFGDYFKREAILWAWELLTDVYKIDKDRLYVTVFEGSADADNLPLDEEALAIWKSTIADDRILFGNKKDNFWEMGDQGPCGPCSEIHADIRSAEERTKTPGADLVNQDHPQVVEIWNLVFMQYNRKADGQLEQLPAKHVDTGMGFERLCMVLQGVQSSYDSDIFVPIIRKIEVITQTEYGKDEKTDVAIRVIADHIRAVAFAIADGQLPSNTGAGYVIRRILRRAIRYGFTFLGTKEPFMFRLVSVLTETMGGAFPELKKQRQLIENVIKEEEHSFLKTLEQGLVLLENVMATAKGKKVDGKKAFELYDTFGFPIDLTALILSERGHTLDEAGFETALSEQKERSRSAAEVSKEDWVVLHDYRSENFIGYDNLEAHVELAKYRRIISKKEGEMYQLVFDKTPFYPEGGGQVGDKGYLEAPNGDVVYIEDTKRENNEIIHFSKNLPTRTSDKLKAVVDKTQRRRTECNHTATHLLHQALREVLGKHVEQKGSAVNSKYLRFDFSHFAKLSVDELQAVENFVNARIEGKLQLQENRNVPMAEALKQGAMALFGEKYGDNVRTIRFGQSVELCGGTHIKNTADIWHFKIRSEGAVASGIRRIEAITSDAVKTFYFENNRVLYEIRDVLNNSQDPLKSVQTLLAENADLKRQLTELQKEKSKGLKGDLWNELQEINGIRFLAKQIDMDVAGIKELSFEMGSHQEDLFLLFAAVQDGKAFLSCYISKDLVANRNLNAATVVKELGQFIQGGGGGQPFFATAGGKNPAGIPEALAKAKQYIG